jgi:hypothetical protein
MRAGWARSQDDKLVDAFIKVGEFYTAESSRVDAAQVLTLFFETLEAEMIRSRTAWWPWPGAKKCCTKRQGPSCRSPLCRLLLRWEN